MSSPSNDNSRSPSSSQPLSIPTPQQPPPSSSITNGSSSNQSSQYYEEDRLARAWKSLASSVVMATQKAEKAIATKPQPTKENLKDLDDAVVSFLKSRIELGRQVSHVQAKLQGKEREMEITDCYMRSQPRLGKKLKRNNDSEEREGGATEVAEAVTAVANQSAEG